MTNDNESLEIDPRASAVLDEAGRSAQAASNSLYHGIVRLGALSGLTHDQTIHVVLVALSRIMVGLTVEYADQDQRGVFINDTCRILKENTLHAVNALGRGRSESPDLHSGGSSRPN